MNTDILTGKSEEHLIIDSESQLYIHKDMVSALSELKKQAALAGFIPAIASGFRGFDAQLRIWNAKASGQRVLLDDNGNALDYNSLSPREIVYAILRWSALPGASRHHWGSDFDVYDKSQMPLDYKVQLIPAEYAPGGVFGDFNEWMNSHLSSLKFFRPYAQDNGGIAPEAWHLSYAPVSMQYQNELSYEIIRSTIESAQIELKEIILDELPEIYERFIDIK